ncbi:transcription factor MtfA phosphoenolpyruvate:gl ucose-phosphotransferase regulator [Formosa agariphila KMM 3901]|uniref:Transcription factor MtfA phosphoenolpyruvate:gl ucose-phosphotransferase regulator n=1 Tax=Formosa agariphila (strain DSM 15362 / KCTC 12365 / LMG 23005 / KMM 3901 / M-2Alg 35-1) TaxID=1347342 RepID=T2KJP8_FORAG|nr:M90 family metallopeptidase [Formosa agariphila]CDF79000.1 transcription factor MtfA phosphoenolpyruvate:gl ucose-phosphotransferase regulator [Formosa agariphila KMM 3901]
MIFVGIAFVILIGFAIFALRKLKTKKADKCPKHWHDLLLKHVDFYTNLSSKQQNQFQKRMMLFLSEVNIEGIQLELQELDSVLIAASAVIPVFGFPEWHYTNLSGVLLYPDNFNSDYEFGSKKENRIIAGMVGTGRLEKQMILSKKALYHGFSNAHDKSNTAIHEFVHLIDKMDGETDGVPEYIMKHAYTIPWLKLIHKEIEAIHNNKSDIRSYGGTNQAEFFAVASEYFFENPKLMKRKHPELFNMLQKSFQLTPNTLRT